uniref:Protein mlo2 n=1 Tax=Talaromyces marneffei PM1 TaxID=1077442 RepID=A0A093VR92_TALMA
MTSPADADRPAEAQNDGKTGQTSTQRRESFASQNSQTAKDFIESQLQLEADAREILPYSFDSCTQDLGPLRQTLFSCLTCNPPPKSDGDPYTPAAVCYSCSISCHGEHTLVELFSKRNFVCDCGTTRFPNTSVCTLRVDQKTKTKGVHSQPPAEGNKYNHNFRNRFCACDEEYDPHKEKGTMFQCLGLGTIETGGCGEDWWHPECLIGLPRGRQNAPMKTEPTPKEDDEAKVDKPTEDNVDEDETPLPPGFPGEDDFETFICYKCLDSNPWLKRYAGTGGFLPAIFKNKPSEKFESTGESDEDKPQDLTQSRKRKADDEDDENQESKKTKVNAQDGLVTIQEERAPTEVPKHKHELLPSEAPFGTFSLFLKEDFREHLCHCPDCFPHLVPHPQLREEEETYEPPLSEDGDDGVNGAGSQGTKSLLDRGEAALSNIDRVRAIEGAMVYNHLRDKVKAFLKPFAESGQAVSAEDIKSYFEKLRGDDMAIREAGGQASAFNSNGGSGRDNDQEGSGANRKEQSGI